MRTQALRAGRRAGLGQLPVPDKDITDSVALLRWLADDHFTFLGYREYRLIEQPAGRARQLRGGPRYRPGHPAPRPGRHPGRCRR